MWQALRQKDAWDDIWAETWGNLGKHVITPNVSSEYKILCLAIAYWCKINIMICIMKYKTFLIQVT